MNNDALRAALRKAVELQQHHTDRIVRDRAVLRIRLARLNQPPARVLSAPADHARFGYPQVIEFGARLAAARPADGSDGIAAAIPGHDAGLDAIGCIERFLQGVADGLESAGSPAPFNELVLFEPQDARRRLLRDVLDRLFEVGTHPPDWQPNDDAWPLVYFPAGPGTRVERPFEKNLSYLNMLTAFVAMPFADDMKDVWRYGIERPSREAGFECQRLDYEAYTGDVVEEIKNRIQRSHLVIADLSRSNPNVFLELGYAWGKNRPTVLLRRAPAPDATGKEKVPFDVAGHNRIEYTDIGNLEEELKKLLRVLHPKIPRAVTD
jgi:hypothetical protein